MVPPAAGDLGAPLGARIGRGFAAQTQPFFSLYIFAPPGPVPRCNYMASRGSYLRRSTFGRSHSAAHESQPSGDSDDDACSSGGEHSSQSTLDVSSDGGEDGDFSLDIAYPSSDPPFHLTPNLAETDALVASTPTAAAASDPDAEEPSEALRVYRYVHSSWKSGEFVMLTELTPEEAQAVNAIINHFNNATDMHGDLVFTDPFQLYHEIVHLEMQPAHREHVLAACGFRLNHEK